MLHNQIKDQIGKLLLVAAILFYVNSFSQILTIADDTDKKGIPFCELSISGKRYYTDSVGNFNINGLPLESLHIRKFGYQDKAVLLSGKTVSHSIFLSPVSTKIEEIKILPKKEVKISPTFKRNNTSSIPAGVSLGFMLVNHSQQNSFIKQLILPVKEVVDNNYYLKLDFYEITDSGMPGDQINRNSQFFPAASLRKGTNLIALKEKISFPKEGVLLSIKIVENIGNYSNIGGSPVIIFYNNKNRTDVYALNDKTLKWEKFPHSLFVIAVGMIILQ